MNEAVEIQRTHPSLQRPKSEFGERVHRNSDKEDCKSDEDKQNHPVVKCFFFLKKKKILLLN